MGTLTVRENLNFSAALRLPSSMSYGERKQRVEKVILELGLTACADTKVDTNTTKFLDLIIHPSSPQAYLRKILVCAIFTL